ncbi:MAG: bifunctional phosphoribosylaminoimidazolecarboxamide formyltransferase/IMP cyclohydrolase [bacterium]
MSTKKRAIISVYDKTGIVEFAKSLQDKFNYEIVSTGGTYDILKQNGVNVIEITELTGFRELLRGRVKTLHPNIHAGILAMKSNESDIEEIIKNGISPVDMVVVNLYPFKDASKKDFSQIEDLVEFVDIGGVTLLRAAAKNYFSVACVNSSTLYEKVLSNLAENNGEVALELRKDLAIEAFAITSDYDSAIANELIKRTSEKTEMPELFSFVAKKKQDLRYGENPHQSAALYATENSLNYEVLNGKELSYNNIADMAAAMNIVTEFIDVPAVAVIKHGNPCGVALGETSYGAYLKAFDCDPISAFGGIIGFNTTVNKQIAKHAASVFLEVLIAPAFDDEALEILKAKKNLRLVTYNFSALEYRNAVKNTVKALPFGTLVQSADVVDLTKDNFNIATTHKPTAEQVEDMIFAWKVAKHVTSNAIVIAKGKKTIGIGAGQTSRIASMELALNQACDGTKDAVIASDGFLPAVDNINAAAYARIGSIIQPGGSIKDREVIEQAEKDGISMVLTGVRHFKH